MRVFLRVIILGAMARRFRIITEAVVVMPDYQTEKWS